MRDLDRSPLDDMDEDALFILLGDAWRDQLLTRTGESYSLPSSSDVGKREFKAVAPVLREALRQPYYHGVVARVASTLQVEADWIMPAVLVTALARRHGMISVTYPAGGLS
jgi:hypothetical protein